ncbi:MAG: hypothetical protein IKT37_07830 [Clostridia bacterium]|nr:hypothetical protein [Clostridia bacterium]
MRYGDEEYGRQLDVIQSIPSNKIDEVNLKNISDEGMRDFEKRHLKELTEQARNMDPDEQIATAAGLRIEVLFNAVGDYITRQELKEKKHEEANDI